MSESHEVIEFKSIGIIHTPYKDDVPRQPDPTGRGKFRIEIFRKYTDSLEKLDTFSHIFVIFHLNRIDDYRIKARPPMGNGMEVGTFASRSPYRPNPLGLSHVRLEGIDENVIHISPIDALDGSPVIDIKPYVGSLDREDSANNGWSDGI